MLRGFVVPLLVLPLAVGCGDTVDVGDGNGASGGGGQSSSGAGGQTTSGDAGGAGGQSSSGVAGGGHGGGGVCPDAQPDIDVCEDPGLECNYGTACCRCEDITCAVLWLCVDPGTNDAACPSVPATIAAACNGDLSCYYCAAGEPLIMFCNQGEWAKGALVGCL